MQKILIIVALLLGVTLLLLGCEQTGLNTDERKVNQQEYDNFTFITSKDRYKELQKNRSDAVSESFEITDISRFEENGNDFLEIEITHHSCDPEAKVIWNGTVAESYPPQVYFFVQLLTDTNCSNTEKKQETVLLNLNKLIKDEFTAKNAIIHVLNASKQSKNNDSSNTPVNSN